MKCTNCKRNDDCQILDPDDCPVGNPDTITLKRIYSTHCQVCGAPFKQLRDIYKIVYFVPLDNNIVCRDCAIDSGYPYEPRIYKEGE